MELNCMSFDFISQKILLGWHQWFLFNTTNGSDSSNSYLAHFSIVQFSHSVLFFVSRYHYCSQRKQSESLHFPASSSFVLSLVPTFGSNLYSNKSKVFSLFFLCKRMSGSFCHIQIVFYIINHSVPCEYLIYSDERTRQKWKELDLSETPLFLLWVDKEYLCQKPI